MRRERARGRAVAPPVWTRSRSTRPRAGSPPALERRGRSCAARPSAAVDRGVGTRPCGRAPGRDSLRHAAARRAPQRRRDPPRRGAVAASPKGDLGVRFTAPCTSGRTTSASPGSSSAARPRRLGRCVRLRRAAASRGRRKERSSRCSTTATPAAITSPSSRSVAPPQSSCSRRHPSLTRAYVAGSLTSPAAAPRRSRLASTHARGSRRRTAEGRTPVIVLMTDGRANVGARAHPATAADATSAAHAVREAGIPVLFPSIRLRARAPGSRAAAEMSAVYLPLPAFDAPAIASEVPIVRGEATDDELAARHHRPGVRFTSQSRIIERGGISWHVQIRVAARRCCSSTAPARRVTRSGASFRCSPGASRSWPRTFPVTPCPTRRRGSSRLCRHGAALEELGPRARARAALRWATPQAPPSSSEWSRARHRPALVIGLGGAHAARGVVRALSVPAARLLAAASDVIDLRVKSRARAWSV